MPGYSLSHFWAHLIGSRGFEASNNHLKVRSPHRRGRAGAAGGQASPPDGPAREKRAAQLLSQMPLLLCPSQRPSGRRWQPRPAVSDAANGFARHAAAPRPEI